MITIDKLIINLKSYVSNQLDILAKDNPIISLSKPLISRALNKNFNKLTNILELLTDDKGNIDIETILSEMLDNIINTNPFIINTPFIGNVVIGNGEIRFNLPLIDKQLLLNTEDLKAFKETLIT